MQRPVLPVANKLTNEMTSMKNLTKSFLFAATVAAFATSVASADDQQHQNRLALQRAQAEAGQHTTTIAFYGNGRGVGQRHTVQAERMTGRFELRSNAHGETFGAWTSQK